MVSPIPSASRVPRVSAHFLDQLDEIDFDAPTSGTGDELRLGARAELERIEQFLAVLDFEQCPLHVDVGELGLGADGAGEEQKRGKCDEERASHARPRGQKLEEVTNGEIEDGGLLTRFRRQRESPLEPQRADG